MLISPHFDLQEFLVSETAARMGREIVPTPIQVRNLERLCFEILEPLRVYMQRPIIVTSGLRPDWLNRRIGGAPGSAHMGGYAADIIAPGVTPLALAGHIHFMTAALGSTLDQCILEFGRWVHVAIGPDTEIPRHEFLTARYTEKGTAYTPGISAERAEQSTVEG